VQTGHLLVAGVAAVGLTTLAQKKRKEEKGIEVSKDDNYRQCDFANKVATQEKRRYV